MLHSTRGDGGFTAEWCRTQISNASEWPDQVTSKGAQHAGLRLDRLLPPSSVSGADMYHPHALVLNALNQIFWGKYLCP